MCVHYTTFSNHFFFTFFSNRKVGLFFALFFSSHYKVTYTNFFKKIHNINKYKNKLFIIQFSKDNPWANFFLACLYIYV